MKCKGCGEEVAFPILSAPGWDEGCYEKALEEGRVESNQEFRWVTINSKDEMEAFYKSILPKIKAAARKCGYAIGIHGSMRRDLDLIAVPWRDDAAGKEVLAREIHRAACGIESQTYQWEEKPCGRVATCFPICFPSWNEPSLGHIDLSVMERTK